MRLLDKGVPLAGEEGCCLLAVVFGFSLYTEFFVGNLLNGIVLGLLGDFYQRRFGFDTFNGHLGDFFFRILDGGLHEHVGLAGVLDEFHAQFGTRHRFCEFFGVARILQFVHKCQNFIIRGFTEYFEHLGDFFKITRFGQSADAGLAVLFGNCRKGRNQGQFFHGCASYATIFIGKGNAFQGALFASVHLLDRLKAPFGVGILPFRFKCVQ